MSSLSKVIVVKLTEPSVHPNADQLELFCVDGFTVVAKKGEYQKGDLAIYVPPDMVVDTQQPEFSWLGDKSRVRTKKLRGVLSYGLMAKARPEFNEGDDVTEILNCKPYEPENTYRDIGGDVAVAPHGECRYTDIESFRKYHRLFKDGEKVVITEKIHGQNARFLYQDGKLHVGTHRQWLKQGKGAVWHCAEQLELEKRLAIYPNHIFFGEAFGWIGDIRYDHKPEQHSLLFFDVFDISSGKYVDYFHFTHIIGEVFDFPFDPPIAPQLWNGIYQGFDSVRLLSDGKSTLADNIREGIVIRPLQERYEQEIGRMIQKPHGDQFLAR